MAIERIVDPSLNNRGDDGAADEQIIEVTLRPTNFNEYIILIVSKFILVICMVLLFKKFIVKISTLVIS